MRQSSQVLHPPAAPRATSVLFVSDVRLYCEAVEYSLTGRSGIDCAGHCAATEALERLADAPIDVVLVDTSSPAGLSLGREIRGRFPEVGILGLALSGDPGRVLECAEAGFTGFLAVDSGIEGLAAAILQMTRGELTCSPRVARMMLERLAALSAAQPERPAAAPAADGGRRGMTLREAEIARLIEAGLTNKEIALRLRISAATVKNHVHNLLEKLEAPRRAAIGRKLSNGLSDGSRLSISGQDL